MNKVLNFTQAYSQAPWRKQLQGIGIFLTILIVILLAASVFVSITARTAALGKDIQRYRQEIETMEHEIADLETQFAELTSADILWERADELGFSAATPDKVLYIRIPGYTGRADVEIAAPAQTVLPASPVLSPAFTQSWIDWLGQQFRTPIVPLADMQP